LALTSGLAAACFVKAFGITFLAIPRSEAAEKAHESPLSMRFGMLLLAVVCIVLGLTPHWTVPIFGNVVDGLIGVPLSPHSFDLSLSLTASPNETVISPAFIGVGLLIFLALPPLLFWLLRVNRPKVGPSWGCGRIGQTPRMEYTATSFAEPLRRIFAAIYRPTKRLSIDFHPESKYFVESIEYKTEITSWFEAMLYYPFLDLIRKLSTLIRQLQSGSLHLYLAYVSIALLVLLLVSRWY
jgi:hydrogenase-4 component B